MSLSEEPVFSTLQSKFVCGWKNNAGESYCGVSGRYDPDNGAAWTTNGAGPHNVQLFVLAADGTVLHCLPGYWEKGDLAGELAFAQELNRVWTDPSLPRAEKDRRFRDMHLDHLKRHSAEMVARSRMQGFDQKFEQRRAETSDCIVREASPRGRESVQVKTTDRVMHERMAQRPFVAYEKFDVEKYTDYGRPKYDKQYVLFTSAQK